MLFIEELSRLRFDIICGNASEAIASLKEAIKLTEHCHCVISSPPYFRKRQYGDSKDEIGNEEEVEDFITKLVDIFCDIPLHPQGSMWINIGDKRDKNGSLMMVPEMFALEMKKRGWILIDSIIWAKQVVKLDGTTDGSCMIEPANGRLNANGYENFYRFVKDRHNVWSDTCAVRIPRKEKDKTIYKRYLPPYLMNTKTDIEGRNISNVWRVPTGKSRLKHFAVFPTSLVERAIAMTCPMFVNPDQTFRSRKVKMEEYNEGKSPDKRIFGKYTSLGEDEENIIQQSGRQDTGSHYIPRKPVTTGWTELDPDWKPGVVWDPFCGTGSVGEAALKMGRSFLGIELYPAFQKMARKKCEDTISFMKHRSYNPFEEFN